MPGIHGMNGEIHIVNPKKECQSRWHLFFGVGSIDLTDKTIYNENNSYVHMKGRGYVYVFAA
jgi:hypothetical protein